MGVNTELKKYSRFWKLVIVSVLPSNCLFNLKTSLKGFLQYVVKQINGIKVICSGVSDQALLLIDCN